MAFAGRGYVWVPSFDPRREREKRGKEGHLGCPEGQKLVQSSVQREESVRSKVAWGSSPVRVCGRM